MASARFHGTGRDPIPGGALVEDRHIDERIGGDRTISAGKHHLFGAHKEMDKAWMPLADQGMPCGRSLVVGG